MADEGTADQKVESSVDGEESISRNDVQNFSEKAAVLESPVSGEPEIQKPKKTEGKLTGWLFLTAITCFLGSSFQFGYNLGVINAPKDVCILFHSLLTA